MALCAIGLGSNLGESQTILESALMALHHAPQIQVTARSAWYKTKAIGPPQPDYFNGCALLTTQLSPQALLETLLTIEAQFGRVRGARWTARTLDLDLLLFEDAILATPTLTIPHPRMADRAFVLIPLAEIAPTWIDPVSGRSIAQQLQALSPIAATEVTRLQTSDVRITLSHIGDI